MTGASDHQGPDRVPVVAAVVTRGSSLLLARRPAGKRHGGLWEFPGGKILSGETTEAAVRRELREELDIGVARVGELLYVARDPDSSFEIHFLAAEIEGTPRAVEHVEVRWVEAAEAGALALAPADRQFVTEVIASAGRATPGTGRAR